MGTEPHKARTHTHTQTMYVYTVQYTTLHAHYTTLHTHLIAYTRLIAYACMHARTYTRVEEKDYNEMRG